MASFSHISGQEPSTISFKVATVVQTRNSSAMHQEILAIGDPDTTNAIAAVLNTAPASTAWALAVREVSTGPYVISSVGGVVTIAGNSTVAPLAGSTWAVRPVQSSQGDLRVTAYQSTAADFNVTAVQGTSPWVVSGASTVAPVAGSTWATRPIQSSQGDLRMTAYQSTAADLNVTVAGYSTTVNVSSLGGAVIVRSSAASLLGTVYQSTAADLQATVTQASTTWAVQLSQYSTTVNVSSLGGAVIVRSSAANALGTVYQSTAADLLATVTIGTNLQSSVMPSSGSSGLVVRQAIDVQNVFASTSALATTSVEVQSSGANLRTYVTAYSITTTNQTAAHWGFFSSNGTLLWPLTLAAISSAVSGVNLAVAAPGYIFRTAGASDALNFKTGGSTVAGVQMGVSYFRAP